MGATSKQVQFKPNCEIREVKRHARSNWYKPFELLEFKEERKDLIRRIRKMGKDQAENADYVLLGLEHLATKELKKKYNSRIGTARSVVMEEQLYAKKNDVETPADKIAQRYQMISEPSHVDAHARAVQTAQELDERVKRVEEDDRDEQDKTVDEDSIDERFEVDEEEEQTEPIKSGTFSIESMIPAETPFIRWDGGSLRNRHLMTSAIAIPQC
eukprot:scaffold4180_cov99-Cylindrotheca_fusiformis.AAC.3